MEFEKQLAEVAQPVTLVWGNKAKYPPIEQAYRLRLTPRQSNLIVLENTGSLAPLESEKVSRALASELDPTIRIYEVG